MVPKTCHILLVEDSGIHAELIREALLSWKADLCIDTVTSVAGARAYLADNVPDLALIDFMLPDGRGTELLSLEDKKDDFPAVLLTASGDEQTAVEAMKSGALDYLVKGADTLCALPRIVERTLREWRNIVRRRKAEQALRESEAKYRSLFEHMSEAVVVSRIVYDPQGNPVDWLVKDINPVYEEIFGIRREEAVGRRASALYGAALDITPVIKTYAEVAETGKPAQLEIFYPITRKHLLISAFSLGGGEYAVLARDVTARRLMEEDLRRLLAELEATLNAIADAVIIYDPVGRIRHMNPAAERMFDYSSEDRTKPIEDRVSHLRIETPEGRPFPLEDVVRRVVAGESMQGVIAVLRQEGGRETWLSNSAAPVYAEDGQRLGAVGTSTDITALHELQKERDLFLHTISHDLRIPLTVIQGYAQVLLGLSGREDSGEQIQPVCTEILKGTRKMSRMIEDLVKTARLEGGKIVPEKTAVEMGSFLRQLARGHAGVIDRDRLQTDVPEGLPPVPADPHLLERIMVNLVTNAQKYSPPESPVRLRVREGDGEIVISVSDSGQGIEPKDQPHIFERFYRPEGSRHRDSVGLGLYITRKLVECHGGRIWVESEPGKGSIFFFTLPVSGSVPHTSEK
jgi:PAS domain S-box-containing protein